MLKRCWKKRLLIYVKVLKKVKEINIILYVRFDLKFFGCNLVVDR